MTLLVRGRRVPVVGDLMRVNGRTAYVPRNLGSRRGDDLALLGSVAELVGLTAEIPPRGRPGGGFDRWARAIATRPEGMTGAEAERLVAEHLGVEVESVRRARARWRRDQRRDQRGPADDTIE